MTTDFESITHQWKIYDLKLDQLVSIHMALTIMAGGIVGRFIRISVLSLALYRLQYFICRELNSPKKNLEWGEDYRPKIS